MGTQFVSKATGINKAGLKISGKIPGTVFAEMFDSYLEKQVIRNEGEIYHFNKQLKIGIINPYVLAEVASRKKMFFTGRLFSKKPVVNNATLDGINNYTRDIQAKPITEKDAFSPDSVLFQPLVSSKIIRQYAPVAMMQPVVFKKVSNKNIGQIHGIKSGVSTGAADEQNPMASEYGKATQVGKATYTTVDENGVPVKKESPVRVKDENDRRELIGDIIQGACRNCWFMAALYSWCWWRKVPPTFRVIDNVLNVYFFEYSNYVWSSVAVPVLSSLPLNASLQPVFAQKTPDKNEIWPALYEKAFSEYLDLTPLTLPGAVEVNPYMDDPPMPYDPDSGTFDQGDPLMALTYISGLLATEGYNNTTNYPSVYDTSKLSTSPYPAKTVFGILEKVNNSTLLTAWPTVAWTFTAGTGPYPASGWPLNTVLAPSHSYSILGRYIDPAGNNIIVLRNPWGLPVNKASAPAQISGLLATGSWKPDLTFPNTIDLAENNYGIFGLENSVFEKYFEGFGWVRFKTVTPA